MLIKRLLVHSSGQLHGHKSNILVIINHCYDLTLLPLKICHGRFRIACRYIFNLWQLPGSQLFGSLVRALDFYLDRPGLNPTIGGNFFSYASLLCYIFHIVRWGLVWDKTLFHRKSLTTVSGSQLFGSLVRALDFYSDRPGLNPTIGGNFFSYASLLC